MKMPEYKSVFREEITCYLKFRESSGIKQIRLEYYSFKQLDTFFIDNGFTEIRFNKMQATEWKRQMPKETYAARYHRINRTKRFFKYLQAKGYDVYVFWDIRLPKSDFMPHIFSKDEIARYFYAVDTMAHKSVKSYEIQMPVLMRLLYCCGTRIDETLSIKKKDVDLAKGIIYLRDTKSREERMIVLSSAMANLIRLYAEKTFHTITERDYIFHTNRWGKIDGKFVHELHVKYLEKAGIPYFGGGKGPRIHDWRHTFAIESLKSMIDSDMDMYAALPILSAYLGHKGIKSTEKYVRLTMSMYPYIEERIGKNLDKIFADYEEGIN